MAEQYQEGQRLLGSDDKIYVVQGGVPREEITPPDVASVYKRPKSPERIAEEERKVRGAEIEEERLDITKRGEKRDIEEKGFSRIGSLRTEFLGIPEVKEFRQVQNATRQIIDLTAKGTPMGNIGSVFSFMKILDPGSTVREGEAASAQNAAGVPDRIRNYYNQMISGEGLSETQRKDMADVARSIYNQRLQGYNSLAETYRGLMSDQGADPDKQGITLATPYEISAAAAAAPEGGARGVPALQIAEGDRISTNRDIEIASLLQGAWQSGKTIDEVNALAIELGTEPLPPQTIEALQSDTARQIRFTPNRSGVREGAGPGMGSALAAGSIRGLTGNLAEEALALADPAAAAKLQAAGEFAQQEFPVSTMVGEVIGGALSPLSRVGPGGTIAGEAIRGGIYGGLYGAGEAAPDAGILERALPTVVGLTTGAGTGALAQRLLGGGGTVAAAGEPPVGGVMPNVPTGAAMAAPVEAAAPPVAAVAPEEAAAELGTLINKASGTGGAAKNAQIKLAEQAQINPEAKAAAERLGIDVPADVFSDNPQVRAAVGLTRSLAGSEAEAGFRSAVSNAVDQADNIMREFDAQFVEGAIAPGVVSQRVKDSLTTTRAELEKQAGDIYKRVDAAVPKQTPVQMDNLFNTLTEIAGEVGQEGMTAPEKKLLGLFQTGEAGGGDITYGRLIREKNLIGKALKRQESPYGSMDEATLKRLYAALASDQLDNVSRVAGEEVRRDLRAANLIYAKERALGNRIVNAFGTDLEGGIANKMRSAITSGAKGEAGDFARLLKTVPDDLRKEVVATALASVTRSARGAEKGGFGFSEFADIYPKLRANPQVYKQIVETLGPKASDTLRDLFQVSKRITEARANVLTTGKANQALVESLNAEGVIGRIMGSTAAKRAVGGTVGAIPGVGFFMPDIMESMAKGNPDAVRAAGKMFSSPEFQVLLNDVATKGDASERAINQVSTSKPFRNFIATIGIKGDKAKDYLKSVAKSTPAVSAGVVATETTGPETPMAAPTVEMRQ
jgi:hypothetical protein